MHSYATTYTFRLIDAKFHIMSIAKDINEKMLVLPSEGLTDVMAYIERNISMPIKKSVLADYTSGVIILYTLDSSIVYPNTIPCLLLKRNDALKMNVIINMTNYCILEKDEFNKVVKIKCDEKRLFSLMCTAWFYRRWTMAEEKYIVNSSLISISANMYAKLLYKVLDRRYSMGSIYSAIDISLAILAYYFADYMVGNHKYASDIAIGIPAIASNRDAVRIIESHASKFTTNQPAFNGFEDLIALINNSFSHIPVIDPLVFMNCFAQMWNGPALPALDFLPYFAMIIFSAYIGGNIGKDLGINGVIKNDADQFMKFIFDTYK